ncbi:MAG TPA: arylsulfatase [Prolixibacteraceae bacterium]|nr:arylsulfatase [Prolixibacteraceae bacterium]
MKHSNRKQKISLVTLLFVLFLSFLDFKIYGKPDNNPNNKIEHPNVILILADDMGLGDISLVNDGRTHTQAINKLANEGMWFRHAYSAAPVCAPARAAMLTGQYPHRTGCVDLNMQRYPEITRMKKGLHTIADVFAANGYATGLVGKWHCGVGEGYDPLSRGFQEFEGFHGFNVPDYFKYELIVKDSLINVKDKYLTEDLTERAIRFVGRHRNEPFFLHLAHYAPHRPLGAPEEVVGKYLEKGFDKNTATVYAMIEIMDDGIGRLVAELDRMNIRKNTLILFSSDNGPDPMAGERFNLNLKGSKYTVNEGGIRVPFIVNWPGKVKPDKIEELVHFTDIFPTLVEVCNLKVPFNQKQDGKSFAGLLKGENNLITATRMWQWNRGVPEYSYNTAIRQGDWKLVRPFVSHWEIPFEKSVLKPVLYNLKDDPEEQNDLSEMNQDIYIELRVKLEQWSREVELDRLKN